MSREKLAGSRRIVEATDTESRSGGLTVRVERPSRKQEMPVAGETA